MCGALIWSEMAAVGDDLQLGVAHKLVDGLALCDGRDVIFGTPNDEHGHFELGQ